MPRIVPMKELRNTNEISAMCHASREPVFVTKNGYGDLVVMSMDAYEDMMAIGRTDQAIIQGEKDIAEGRYMDADEAFAKLGSRHHGAL